MSAAITAATMPDSFIDIPIDSPNAYNAPNGTTKNANRKRIYVVQALRCSLTAPQSTEPA